MRIDSTFLIIGLGLAAEDSLACSLAELDQALLKQNVADEIEASLTQRYEDVDQVLVEDRNLTYFEVFFPDGLGADCSGLESAYTESSYYVSFWSESLGKCRSVGLVRVAGYDVDGAATVTPMRDECGL